MQGKFDPKRHRQAWAKLSFSERRQIIKAVNKGQALDRVKDARLAVGVASNQMRFWRLAWLIGPAGALFQLGRGVAQFVLNMIVATAVLGVLSWWFYRRAARAHAVNLEVATTGKRPKKGGGKGRTGGGKTGKGRDKGSGEKGGKGREERA